MLSEHERSEKVQRGRELIEELMQDLNSEFGVSAVQHALPNGAGWWFNLRNNPMMIVLMEFPPDVEIYAGSIIVNAYVAGLPTRNLLPLYRHLLEKNANVIEGAFAVNDDDWITFCIRRDVDSVDTKEELENLVVSAALQRQVYLEDLSNEFGCIPLDPWTLPTS